MLQRRVDELGRIVIPSEFRDKLGIESKTLVGIALDGERVVLKKAELTCRICGSGRDINEKFMVCAECVGKIKAL